MARKHTPGPWTVATYTGNCGAYHITEAEKMISGMHDAEGWTESQSMMDEANARLIAAAPELLEALEYCERAMTLAVACSGATPEEGSALQKARAAIAKATGGEHATAA